MKRFAFVILVFALLLSACEVPAASEEPAAAAATRTPPYTPTRRPTATRTPWPTSVTPPLPSLVATPTPPPGWSTYTNEYLGYSFHYPSTVTITGRTSATIITGDAIPAGFTFDSYFDYLDVVLPDDLCIYVTTQGAMFTVRLPGGGIGRFVDPVCPGLGVGDAYRFEEASETFVIDGGEYTVDGKKLYLNSTGEFHGEIYLFTLENGFQMAFIGTPGEGQSYDSYLTHRASLMEVLASLHWFRTPDLTAPGTSCAAGRTRLLPGVEAVVRETTRARRSPEMSSEMLADLPPGAVVIVREGPVCAEEQILWRVESELIPGGSGWVVEYDGQHYSLEQERALPSNPTPAPDCTAGWTQLEIGNYAVVAEGDPNRVRSGPSRDDEIIAQIYPGTIVLLVEGPVCAAGLVFWRVENNSIPGSLGWTAEGDLQDYWLEPYQP